MRRLKVFVLPVFMLASSFASSFADAKTIPVDRVVSAYDGDTVTVEYMQDGKRVKESIRVRNIDTPELGWRAKCERENYVAVKARSEARRFLAIGEDVELVDVISRDRYGRLRARVEVDGRDLGEHLIAEGLARRWVEKGWNGVEKDWCAE